MPGYLVLGDPGIDHRGSELKHGVVQLGYRFGSMLGAQLALGAHGSDPVHVESAWLQGGGSWEGARWTLGAGRQGPTLGPVISRAGHLDRFGLTPLAKDATLNGDWIEDGSELGLRRRDGSVEWRFDAGVWRGRKFPGASGSAAFPSLHVGANWEASVGELSADAFAAQLRPEGRGSRVANAPGGHTHSAPVCDDSLRDVVCFDGRSRVAGLSAQWQGSSWPIILSGAMLWRHETGTLQSRDGLGDYEGRTRGDWLDGVWRVAPKLDLGIRRETLQARQSLAGSGASLVASNAGLGAYAPLRRLTTMLGFAVMPWADLRVEWGRETSGSLASDFAALRLVVHWEHRFEDAAPRSSLLHH